MSQTETSLDALMTRLADGDRTAFSDVFERVWGPVLRLCRNLLKNDADAADAAQEALQKILERASDYDRTRPALPWSLAIAGWECRTILRKRGRRGEVCDEHLPEFAGEHPEQKLIERDLVAAALTAVGELSENDREVLLATFGEECASATGSTLSGATLRKRRERALSRLRDTFRRLYGFD
jgi:RNA polymerase sigma-70 factor, ECF subfamily